MENVMNKRINPIIRAALRRLALASSMLCASHALEASPFTYAAYGYFQTIGAVVLEDDQSASGTASVSGSDGQKARASYGDNGVALPPGGGYALSVWSDGFVVNGGSGDGTLNFSVRFHGTLFDPQDTTYALLMAVDPVAFSPAAIVADADYGYVNLPATTSLLVEVDATPDFAPGLNVYQFSPGFIDELINVSVPFTYGHTFYLASVLDIGGYGDFYHSAKFGITAPEGAVINSLSGSFYPAAAVPELETWVMTLAGLSLLVVQHRRKA